ncbi:DUF4192 domain-containing protein [uncultured Jatrophihabitans sp.]|uniref:DUF4192 domain-containing protein n=1 Tax=uncultured Jatrophihabitans sp. TaxID=1610747 RepID=UPI0035CA4DD0
MTTASIHGQRISGPADLLQAVPYLLGFCPRESLVLVGLHDARLVVTARLDLADAQHGPTLAHTVAAMVNGGVSAFVAVVYPDTPEPVAIASIEPSWLPLARMIAEQAAAVDCELVDVLLVAGRRWRSVGCRDDDCCPPDGWPLSAQPSAYAAAATVAGVVALPDRRDLEAVLDPAPAAQRSVVAAAIGEAENAAVRAVLDGAGGRHARSVKRALFSAARAAHEPRWAGCPDLDVARFAVALSGGDLRDAVWLAIDDGRLDGRPLWRELVRRAPAPYDAAPAFLYGWASWRSGDGARAGIAAQRALDSDPQFSPADMLLAALSHGIDPRRFPRLRRRPA